MTTQDAELAKFRWRCRRGMRELDALLFAWLDHHYGEADEQKRLLFDSLLNMQDPDIMDMINTKSSPSHNSDNAQDEPPHSSKDSGFENLIDEIRHFLPN